MKKYEYKLLKEDSKLSVDENTLRILTIALQNLWQKDKTTQRYASNKEYEFVMKQLNLAK